MGRRISENASYRTAFAYCIPWSGYRGELWKNNTIISRFPRNPDIFSFYSRERTYFRYVAIHSLVILYPATLRSWMERASRIEGKIVELSRFLCARRANFEANLDKFHFSITLGCFFAVVNQIPMFSTGKARHTESFLPRNTRCISTRQASHRLRVPRILLDGSTN